MKRFTYADQNYTYSNLIHLIYRVANYLELRHVVSNSHRAMVYQLLRFFPENSSFFTVGLLNLASPMIIDPPQFGINLAKNRSCISLALEGKVTNHISQVIRTTF